MAGKQLHAVELREDEMVAIVVRAFFEVPEDETAENVVAHTDPGFLRFAREVVRGLMLYWKAKIDTSSTGMNELQKAQASMAAGLSEGGRQ